MKRLRDSGLLTSVTEYQSRRTTCQTEQALEDIERGFQKAELEALSAPMKALTAALHQDFGQKATTEALQAHREQKRAALHPSHAIYVDPLVQSEEEAREVRQMLERVSKPLGATTDIFTLMKLLSEAARAIMTDTVAIANGEASLTRYQIYEMISVSGRKVQFMYLGRGNDSAPQIAVYLIQSGNQSFAPGKQEGILLLPRIASVKPVRLDGRAP